MAELDETSPTVRNDQLVPFQLVEKKVFGQVDFAEIHMRCSRTVRPKMDLRPKPFIDIATAENKGQKAVCVSYVDFCYCYCLFSAFPKKRERNDDVDDIVISICVGWL